MRVKQVLDQLNEGVLGFLMGAAVGNMVHQKKVDGVLALAVTAATYASLTKLAPTQRKVLTVTATTQSEAIANHKLVQNLLDKMSYKLDNVEYIGTHGRRWTLSAK